MTVVAEAGGNQAQVNSGWIVQAEFERNSGVDFNWNLSYYHKNPSGSNFLRVELNGSLTLAPDTLDDQWHKVTIEIVPATVTGAFNGSGGVGFATIAMDGSCRLLIDDVEVLAASNIDLVVNRFATTTPTGTASRRASRISTAGARWWIAAANIAPPFSAADKVEELSRLFKSYGCTTAVGDRYAGDIMAEIFRKHGIMTTPARSKSDTEQATQVTPTRARPRVAHRSALVRCQSAAPQDLPPRRDV